MVVFDCVKASISPELCDLCEGDELESKAAFLQKELLDKLCHDEPRAVAVAVVEGTRYVGNQVGSGEGVLKATDYIELSGKWNRVVHAQEVLEQWMSIQNQSAVLTAVALAPASGVQVAQPDVLTAVSLAPVNKVNMRQHNDEKKLKKDDGVDIEDRDVAVVSVRQARTPRRSAAGVQAILEKIKGGSRSQPQESPEAGRAKVKRPEKSREPSTTPRGRGRPRKVIKVETDDETGEPDQSEVKTGLAKQRKDTKEDGKDSGGVTPARRGRGRPRKMETEELIKSHDLPMEHVEYDKSVEDDNSSPAGKKRGRPRKGSKMQLECAESDSKCDLKPVTVVDPDIGSTYFDPQMDTESTPVRSGRGRPRTCRKQPDTTPGPDIDSRDDKDTPSSTRATPKNSTSMHDSAAETPVEKKRGPGRPRKSLVKKESPDGIVDRSTECVKPSTLENSNVTDQKHENQENIAISGGVDDHDDSMNTLVDEDKCDPDFKFPEEESSGNTGRLAGAHLSDLYKSLSSLSNNVYSCNRCKYSTSEWKYMTCHIRRAHMAKKFPCNQCDKKFGLKKDLKAHLLTHERSIKCTVCDKTFAKRFQMEQHHGRRHCPKDQTNDQNKEPHLSCTQCSYVTCKRFHLTCHIKRHHSLREYSCPVCNKTYGLKKDLTQHLQCHSNVWQCPDCGRIMKSKYSLQMHINIIHRKVPRPKTKPYLCTLCGKVARNKTDYTIHQNKEHLGVRPFNCQVCEMAFFSKVSLRIHMQTHSDNRPFSCKLCWKTFKQRQGLRVHAMVHTDHKDRRFKCRNCDKLFSQKASLLRHERLHSGLKPYACKYCEGKFNDYSILRRHLMGRHKLLNSVEVRALVQHAIDEANKILMSPEGVDSSLNAVSLERDREQRRLSRRAKLKLQRRQGTVSLPTFILDPSGKSAMVQPKIEPNTGHSLLHTTHNYHDYASQSGAAEQSKVSLHTELGLPSREVVHKPLGNNLQSEPRVVVTEDTTGETKETTIIIKLRNENGEEVTATLDSSTLHHMKDDEAAYHMVHSSQQGAVGPGTSSGYMHDGQSVVSYASNVIDSSASQEPAMLVSEVGGNSSEHAEGADPSISLQTASVVEVVEEDNMAQDAVSLVEQALQLGVPSSQATDTQILLPGSSSGNLPPSNEGQVYMAGGDGEVLTTSEISAHDGGRVIMTDENGHVLTTTGDGNEQVIGTDENGDYIMGVTAADEHGNSYVIPAGSGDQIIVITNMADDQQEDPRMDQSQEVIHMYTPDNDQGQGFDSESIVAQLVAQGYGPGTSQAAAVLEAMMHNPNSQT